MAAFLEEVDCVVAGAGFAGLAAATALARSGMSVRVLERKADVGEKLHTTGILVREAIEGSTLLDHLPSELVRRATGVRLYSPNLRHIDLSAPGYYFLATNTPDLMRWLADKAEKAGAVIRLRNTFSGAERTRSGFRLRGWGRTRYLIGADGPRSTVATSFGLGRNENFLFGIEHEYSGVEIPDPHLLHCFVDRRLAPGYIGWVVAGPGSLQVGLARRLRGHRPPATEALDAFLRKIDPIFPLKGLSPASVRAGMIPCGGVVQPVGAPRVLLAGDAGGMVSPVTTGGIHTALRHGSAAGHAVADFLSGRCEDPSGWLVRSYPTFRGKLALRGLFDRFQSDLLVDLLLGTKAMRSFAERIYFHRKGAHPLMRGEAPREDPT